MQYTNLGRTGLSVSRLCGPGTFSFGQPITEPDSFGIMDDALEVGINLLDTADAYGPTPGEGEEMIGRWLAQGGGRRDRVVLATKLYCPMGEEPNNGGLSAYHIRRACDESLHRLQTDRIDLYQMHHVERTTPWEEIWQAMEQLVQAGKALYIGSSNFAGWDIAQAQGAAAARHFMGLASEQSVYHLNARTIEIEVIPACRACGVGLLPYRPLGGGLLCGALEKVTGGRRGSKWIKPFVEKHQRQLKEYEALCGELGEAPADVALAWVLHNPVVTAPLIGPRTSEQLRGCLRALDLQLDDAVMARLDEIWPGPGGEAPGAYAW